MDRRRRARGAAPQDRALFWIAANLVGLCLGSSQSAGRALVGYLSPPARTAEFFGLWGLAVKLSAVLGPLTYGFVTWLSMATTALRCSSPAFISSDRSRRIDVARVNVARAEEALRHWRAAVPALHPLESPRLAIESRRIDVARSEGRVVLKWIVGSKVDHPLADPKQAKALVAELPAARLPQGAG